MNEFWFVKKLLKLLRTNGLIGNPWHDGGAGRVLFGHLIDEMDFGCPARAEERIGGLSFDEALVNDPGEGLDLSAAQVRLERRCFVNRRCLRQGYNEDLGKFGVTETG